MSSDGVLVLSFVSDIIWRQFIEESPQGGGSSSLSGCHFFHRHPLEACDSANESTWTELYESFEIFEKHYFFASGGRLKVGGDPQNHGFRQISLCISQWNYNGKIDGLNFGRSYLQVELTDLLNFLFSWKFNPCALICAIARLQRVSVKKTARW